MINVECSSCGANFRASDEHLGKKAKCPKCSTVIVISPKEEVRAQELFPEPASASPPWNDWLLECR